MNLFNQPLFSKKGLFSAFFAILLIVGLVVTIVQVQKQQEIRQRAAPACGTSQGKCSWTTPTGAAKYRVKVVDDSLPPKIVFPEKDVTGNEITFPVEAGRKYTCTVIPLNTEGLCPGTPGTDTTSEACTGIAAATNTPVPTSPGATNTPIPTRATTPTTPPGTTPTPTKTPTPTPTGAPTATPSPTGAPTATPTSTPTPTKTPTPTPTRTPTPTPVPPTATPIPPTAIPPTPTTVVVVPTTPPVVATSVPLPTNTPRPTIVPTGDIGRSIGIVSVIVLTVIGGILLLAL